MKVLLVNGSPHKEGCTYTALKEVEKELCYDNYMTPSEAKKFGIIDKIDVVLA